MINVLLREAVEKPRQLMQALAANIDRLVNKKNINRLVFTFSIFDRLTSGVSFVVGVLSMGRGGSITLSTLSFSTSLHICSTQNYFSSARSRTRMKLSRAVARQRQRLSLGQLESLLDVSYNPSNSLLLTSGKHLGMKIDKWKHNLDYIEPSFDL